MSYGLNVKETIKQYDFKNIHFLVDLDQTSYNEYTILDFDYLKEFGLPFQLIFQKVPNKLKEYYSVFGDNILCNYSIFFRDAIGGYFIYYNGHEYKCEYKENSTYEVKALGATIVTNKYKMYMNGIEYSFKYFCATENNEEIYYATNIKKINEEIQLVYFNRWDNIFDYCITFKSKKFGKNKVEIHIYDDYGENEIYFEFKKK